MDPHDVLNLRRGAFSLEELRTNYKSLARQLHPDKCGARMGAEQANQMFVILTDAYKQLLKLLRARQNDRSFHELREASRADLSTQGNSGDVPPGHVMTSPGSSRSGAGTRAAPDSTSHPPLDPTKFNVARFNEVFDGNRLTDVHDRGYKAWIERTQREPVIPSRRQRQLIKYEEPLPVSSSRRGATAYTELGTERISDFSRDDVVRHGIEYTDFRVAHTTSMLVDEGAVTPRIEFSTVDQLQAHRASQPLTATEEDLRLQAERKRREAERELERERVQKQRDQIISDHYDRVHRALLGHR